MNIYHYRLSSKGFHIQQTLKTKISFTDMELRGSLIAGAKDF